MNSANLFVAVCLFYWTAGGRDHWVIDTDTEQNSSALLLSIAHNVSNTDGDVLITIRGSKPLVLEMTAVFENVSCVNVTCEQQTIVECGGKQLGGIWFVNSRNISLQGLVLRKCGDSWNSYNITLLFYVCRDIKLDNVLVGESLGFAIMFWETRGKNEIENVTVYRACQNSVNCSGLGIVFTFCPITNNESDYTIENCTFLKYNDIKEKITSANEDLSEIEYGGGLGIVFKDGACWNKINITHSNISKNSAYWGGGMFILQTKTAQNNVVLVSHSVFSLNTAVVGGGGASMGFFYDKPNVSLANTTYTFYNCSFTRNRAKFGAGTVVFSSHLEIPTTHPSVQFRMCVWMRNTACFSNDVDLAPSRNDRSGSGYLPTVQFVDVQFLSTRILVPDDNYVSTYSTYGSFGSTLFTVQFGGKVVFRNLKSTALHLSSSTVKLLPESHVVFANNKGNNGAALAMYGFSSLVLEENCTLSFIQNKATVYGGAIYFETTDVHEFQSNAKCFIGYNGNTENPSERNISVTFTDNHASIAGNAIYALSLLSCYFEWNPSTNEEPVINSSLFTNIGNFTFSPEDGAIATAGARFNSSSDIPQVIPGKCFEYTITAEDELGQVYEQDFNLAVIKGDISFARHYLSQNICLSGTPGDEGVIQVSTVGFRKRSYYLNVSMSSCPPGFYHDTYERVCKCGAETTEHAYTGIDKCSMITFQAVINPSYWAGYVNDELLTAPCPLGICKLVRYLTSSQEELNRIMCGEYRTGIVCGHCRDNLSVYYHSPKITCGESDLCSLGFVFYILSEVLPLMLLLTLIVIFDFQLTFGVANAITLFAQLLNVLSLSGRGIIVFTKPLEILADISLVVYGILNLDFFVVESLSFCLWRGATVLQMLAVKYITTVLAVVFVLLLVLCLHYFQCRKVCVVKKKVSSKESVIHGLTAILVMSYSQCTKVSFELLTFVALYGEGKRERLTVTFYGGIEYLKQDHIHYAIPASIYLALVVTLSPLLLLIYPFHLKLLALCGSRRGEMVSRILLINKIKPILDSFQGTFKDNCRFFAGFYFLYRIAILSASAFTRTALHAHLIMELLLIIIIGIHATVWPYQKNVHNVFDICILVNMALINALSLYAYVVEIFSENFDHSAVTSLISLQITLMFIPLVAIILYYVLGWPVAAYVRAHRSTKMTNLTNSQDYSETDGFDRIIDHDQLSYHEY